MEEKVILQTPWFLSSEEILNKLNTSINGLDDGEAEKRLKLNEA